MSRHSPPRDTASDDVVRRLRQDILGGALPPGTRIKVEELARRYDVSPMPVREAIRTLEGEGIVETSPRRGARVVAIDEGFIRNVYDMREALEGMLAARCAERAGPADVAAIRATAAEHEEAVRGGALEAVVDLDRRLHLAIADAAGNPPARRAITIGRGLIEALRLRAGFTPTRLARIVQEHTALADAIAGRDAHAAGLVARIHVIGARDDLLAFLARPGHAGPAPRTLRRRRD
jgi:DNA-binding GntR family transcriptional regulator